MNIVWKLGEVTVRDILNNLADDRHLAYTSAATIMRILEQKNFARAEKRGKVYFYTAMVKKDIYQARSLHDISEKLFDNTPVLMATRLIDNENMSIESLIEIKKLLDDKLGS